MSRLEALWGRLARWLLPDCAIRLRANGWVSYATDAFYGLPAIHEHYIDGHCFILVDHGMDKLCVDCGRRLRHVRWPSIRLLTTAQ